MKIPNVSVIIPTYNYRRYITESIDSVLAQSYKDFEIIVIDDGSTDNTEEVLEPYIETGKIKYFYQNNRGIAAARNRGIKEAEGEYVAFLDADDFWYPNKLECQTEYLRTNPQIGLICSNADRFNEHGLLNGTKLDGVVVKNPIGLGQLLYRNFIQTLTVMVRKDCIENVGCFNETKDSRFVEDYELWLRITMKYPIYYIKEPLAGYRNHSGSDSSNIKKVRIAVINLLKRLCDEYPEIEIENKNIIQKAIANRLFEIGYDYFSRSETKESCRYLFASLKYNPRSILTYMYLIFSRLPSFFVARFKKIKHRIIKSCMLRKSPRLCSFRKS